MRFFGALIFWIVIAIIAYFIFAFSGVYSVGADVPHWRITEQAIDLVRENAVERRTSDIKPPPLDDPALVKLGAVTYSKACTGCHLSPVKDHTGFRDGLYPHPPNLTRFSPDPAEAFWVIKHGLKMTAMPAWHEMFDDHTIWAVVAYLRKQPKMGADEFKALTMPEPAPPPPAPAVPASTATPAAAASAG